MIFLQKRRCIAKLLLVTCAVLVALLVAEMSLRLYGFTYFNPYIVDEDVGYSLRPGAEGWWTLEGLTYIKINSQGFRDREHPISKPSGTFRIAILGDSFVEAFQVPLEKAFSSIIEQRVQQCPRAANRKVEVLSFGVSGFSTARELITLRKRVWQYSPDVVVLLFTPGNDIRDNSRSLNRYAGKPLPYFVLHDGELVLDDSLLAARNRALTFRLQRSIAGRAFNWLQSHSRILGLIYAVREAKGSLQQNVGAPRSFDEPGLDDQIYRAPATAEWEDAWRVTETLLVKMRDEVEARGAKFIVVIGSAGIQVNPDAKARQGFMTRLGVTSLFYPNDRIQSLGNSKDFTVVNLAPTLLEYASKSGAYVHGAAATGGRGHWNEVGHRLAGELLSDQICHNGL
jgi:hypothetical protein